MASSTAQLKFTGPYAAELAELEDLIESLWIEHGTSFVKAGDNKVFAFGGDGYMIIFDEARWDGLIELITPKGTAGMNRDETGSTVVISSAQDVKTVRDLIKDGITGLKAYYQNRYWTTPGGPKA